MDGWKHMATAKCKLRLIQSGLESSFTEYSPGGTNQQRVGCVERKVITKCTNLRWDNQALGGGYWNTPNTCIRTRHTNRRPYMCEQGKYFYCNHVKPHFMMESRLVLLLLFTVRFLFEKRDVIGPILFCTNTFRCRSVTKCQKLTYIFLIYHFV